MFDTLNFILQVPFIQVSGGSAMRYWLTYKSIEKSKRGGRTMKSMEKMLLILLPVLLIFTITAFSANQPTASEAGTRASERGSGIESSLSEDGNAEESTEQAAGESGQEEPPLVFMTKDISSQGLMRIYEALNREATGKVAVKMQLRLGL